ncbi:unnamed protein product, partial [Gongylonema pulchrum]|uniref:SSD domain-containing protein n=1 Tax=Gongylonema pulchrum TaxID=637853 RepID=A0A183D018_9BILA
LLEEYRKEKAGKIRGESTNLTYPIARFSGFDVHLERNFYGVRLRPYKNVIAGAKKPLATASEMDTLRAITNIEHIQVVFMFFQGLVDSVGMEAKLNAWEVAVYKYATQNYTNQPIKMLVLGAEIVNQELIRDSQRMAPYFVVGGILLTLCVTLLLSTSVSSSSVKYHFIERLLKSFWKDNFRFLGNVSGCGDFSIRQCAIVWCHASGQTSRCIRCYRLSGACNHSHVWPLRFGSVANEHHHAHHALPRDGNRSENFIPIWRIFLGWLCGILANRYNPMLQLRLLPAVGVNGAFLVIHSWLRSVSECSVAQRLGFVLEEAGPSITMSTLTNVITFGIGALTPTPGK